MKKIALFGSTGSIGTTTLKIVERFPDLFDISVLAAHSNIDLLTLQILKFHPKLVVLFDEKKSAELKARFPKQKILFGEEGLLEAAVHPLVDFVVMAIVGTAALKPTVYALEAGKTVGLASKEVMVAAGELISQIIKKTNSLLLPIDSEHSAIFQCLEGKNIADVERLILTASGGPFFNHTKEQLSKITVEEALVHPNWNMGPKITIDSSNLINKGLEKIEARWLFNIPGEKIEVVIHPQSIVHSFVEFIDGSLLAQISEPNMIYPIQYALTYPERKSKILPPFDFFKNNNLQFFPPDHEKFPALSLVEEALRMGGSAPCYLNAANEVLVHLFLRGKIAWLEILQKLENLLSAHRITYPKTIEAVLMVDQEARSEALAIKK
ncbi:MAG: 1-deoxy-D-xylulose-5-phosphate reductoisomerase [Chlamydiales bacterium]